jgi:hypothetical protein
MSIVPVEEDKALVSFESFSPTQFELTITNIENKILYFKKSENALENHSTVFDFSKLGDGIYNVQIDFGNCSLAKEVNVASNHVKIGEFSKQCKPYIQFNEGLLQISMLNKEQKNVYLNVYQNGEHIDGNRLGKKFCIQKQVDFSKLKKGTYEFVLSGGFSNYAFTVYNNN